MTETLSAAYGRLLEFLLGIACVLLFLTMLVIGLDVLLRNVPVLPGTRGFPAANELSELALYLIATLSAPWLMRQGLHIRVDILLRAIPPRLAWFFEWCMDLFAITCCVVAFWYSVDALLQSRAAGSQLIKSFIMPEWWTLVPLPLMFVLLAIEILFRMHRLQAGPRAAREDAVSAS